MKKILSILALMVVAMTAKAAEGGFAVKTESAEHCTNIAYTVNGSAVDSYTEGDVVTITVTPDDGYVIASVIGRIYAGWGGSRAASLDIKSEVEITKVKDNVYTFTMPRGSVKITVLCEIQVPSGKTDPEGGGGSTEVVSVAVNMSSVEGSTPTVDAEGVTHYAVKVDSITIPKTTTQKEIAVVVPATTKVGNNEFTVVEIGTKAFKGSTTGTTKTKVTKVILPETEEPIKIDEGAMKPDGNPIAVESPLKMLDDYALMTTLKENFEAVKVSAIAKAPNRYWSFSSGVDVIVPEGVTVYGVYNDDGEIRIKPLDEVNNSGVIKANNGVLISCNNGKGGNAYEMVAKPGGQKSGTTPAITDADSYKGNVMTPVIVEKHYSSSEILILKNNEFHTIAESTEDVKVPACKAVYSFAKQ